MTAAESLSLSPFSLLVLARFSASIVALLVLTWALHFKTSFYPSSSPQEDLIYAVLHPLFMVIGFILISGEAILVHRWLPGSRNLKKSVHLCLQGLALACGIFGIWTKFHSRDGIVANFYSLHSWMGIICVSLFGAQILLPSMEEALVGFDDHAENIKKFLMGSSKNYLMRSTKNVDVISIVGVAGIGKTALARKIYNSRSVINHFEVRAWCSLSEIYSRRKLSIEILRQITGDHHKYVDVDYPEDILRKLLDGKRYLIVLDELWEDEAWDDLQTCFPNGNNGSRILVTTRDEDVAYYINWFSRRYWLPFLNAEKSWELLEKKVFQGKNNSCPLELRNVGKLVAKQCKGLPSTIISIAGILSSKGRDASLWLEIARDISSHAFEMETSMKTIQSSYDLLPNLLRPCLLYMGLFPKGYEIPVYDLLKWWIAEEFVQEADALKLEESSEIWLNVLVRRSLVVVSKRSLSGAMKCCILLDQVREFCLRKIREEKFMQLIAPYQSRHERRLCMYVHDTLRSGDFKESQEFIVHPKFSRLDRKNPFRLLNNLRHVRVLHLLDIYLDNSLASAFQSLPQLRYLAIFVKAFDVKWVSHLLHLQTLRVYSSYIMISPAIWKMSKLRHVDMNEFPITMSSCEEEDDIVLRNLKTLGLCYMSVADMTPNFWDKFPNLEQLRLHINKFPNHVPDALMNSDVTLPSRLRSLSLSEIILTDEIVSSIANLQNLETLKLSEIFFTGEKHWDLGDNTFKQLKFLKLHRVFMNTWSCSHKSFPIIEYLVVKSCSKLGEIPIEFANFLLRSIKVIDCSDSVGNSAAMIKQAFDEKHWSSIQVHILKKDK